MELMGGRSRVAKVSDLGDLVAYVFAMPDEQVNDNGVLTVYASHFSSTVSDYGLVDSSSLTGFIHSE